MTYVIAEAGINHNGSVDRAKEMVEVAKECGADCVKFQYFFADETREVWDKIKDYRLTHEELRALKQYCKSNDIDFLCSAFGKDSALGLLLIDNRIKIPSGKIVDLDFLKYISDKFDRFILSTGMANQKEIGDAVNAIGCDKKIDILHCVSAYPTPIKELNLKAIQYLKRLFQSRSIGFSDHSINIFSGGMAVACGAEIIEKHFTLDSDSIGPDHKMSLEPDELSYYIRYIRLTEQALGDGVIGCQECERPLLHRRQI